MARELVPALYRRLLALYPRSFRERFGVSMEQTFADLRTERRRGGRSLLPITLSVFTGTALGAVSERLTGLAREDVMKPAPAAIISSLLLLPFVLAFLVATLNIEPVNSLIRDLGTGADGSTNPAGFAVQLGLLALVMAAGFVSVSSVARTVRTAGHPFANPANLAIAGVVAFLLITLGSVIVIDQLPCWMGEPNCD